MTSYTSEKRLNATYRKMFSASLWRRVAETTKEIIGEAKMNAQWREVSCWPTVSNGMSGGFDCYAKLFEDENGHRVVCLGGVNPSTGESWEESPEEVAR